MCKKCDVCMKTIEITMNRIQNPGDGVSLNKGLLKALKSVKIEGLRIWYILLRNLVWVCTF